MQETLLHDFYLDIKYFTCIFYFQENVKKEYILLISFRDLIPRRKIMQSVTYQIKL